MAIGNGEIEETISAMPNISRAESVDSIELIEEILTYENYDYIIVNILLSTRKTAKLADFVENSLDSAVKPKIIVLVENLNDKKLTAQLVGLGINAFVSFNELSLVGRYMEHYPSSFDLSIIADKNSKADITATRVVNGTISIGVFNLDNGAGATTCSLKLAEEIANCGYRVICMEIDQDNFQYVRNKNKNLELISTTKEKKDSILQAAFGDKSYTFIIIDFGKVIEINPQIKEGDKFIVTKKEYKDDFFRCTYKVGMGFASPWHTYKLKAFLTKSFFSFDLVNNQLFLLLSGEGYQDAAEDYHEIPIWSRDELEEFISDFKLIIGIDNITKVKKKFKLWRR